MEVIEYIAHVLSEPDGLPFIVIILVIILLTSVIRYTSNRQSIIDTINQELNTVQKQIKTLNGADGTLEQQLKKIETQLIQKRKEHLKQENIKIILKIEKQLDQLEQHFKERG